MGNLLMTAENGSKVFQGAKTMTRRLKGLEAVNVKPDEWVYQGCDLVLNKYYFYSKAYCDHISGDANMQTCKPQFHVGDIVAIREPHYLWGFWATTGVLKSGRSQWTFVNLNTELLSPIGLV